MLNSIKNDKCIIFFIILCALSTKPCTSGDNVIKGEKFWSYDAIYVNNEDAAHFNDWYRDSNFKEISQKISGAFFFKDPWGQNVVIDNNSNLVFERKFDDIHQHSMIELSVNNEPNKGAFINYGGYRSMALSKPYRIELEALVSGSDWWKKINWMLVFQGHAIPDIFDVGKKFNPPFALLISRGRWEVHVRADSRLSLPIDKSYERFDIFDLGPVDFDTFTTFTIDVTWGYTNSNGKTPGNLTLLRDGKVHHKEEGRMNFYNNRAYSGKNLGPYLMLGAYTPLFDENDKKIVVKVRRLSIFE